MESGVDSPLRHRTRGRRRSGDGCDPAVCTHRVRLLSKRSRPVGRVYAGPVHDGLCSAPVWRNRRGIDVPGIRLSDHPERRSPLHHDPSFAVLFAAAHTGNLHASWLPIFNTFLWGVVLGYAYVRSGDLWLPIGLHFGWNLALPLLGAPLSGFAMPVTGFTLTWSVPGLVSGGSYGPEGGVVTTVMAILLFVWLVKARIEKQPTALWVSSNQDEE